MKFLIARRGAPGVILKKICEGCNGTNAQINEHGLVRFCQECGSNWDTYKNKYGSDPAEHPEFFITHSVAPRPVVVRIDSRKDYILLPGNKAIPLKK